MTTVIAVYSLKGCVSMCDARCHNAKQPSELKEPRRNACMCICGGANHGLGFVHAYKAVTGRGVGLSRAALETFAKERGLPIEELLVIDRTRVHSDHMARRLVKARRQPIPANDLFACEAAE
jgi:hypothetical protein